MVAMSLHSLPLFPSVFYLPPLYDRRQLLASKHRMLRSKGFPAQNCHFMLPGAASLSAKAQGDRQRWPFRIFPLLLLTLAAVINIGEVIGTNEENNIGQNPADAVGNFPDDVPTAGRFDGAIILTSHP